MMKMYGHEHCSTEDYIFSIQLLKFAFFMNLQRLCILTNELRGFLLLIHLFNIPARHPAPFSPIDQHQQEDEISTK